MPRIPWALAVAVAGAAWLAVCGCGGAPRDRAAPPWDPASDPLPARWIDPSGLHGPGFGEVLFETRDGHVLTAYTYRSTEFDPDGGPVWFVMHGARRDAGRYIRAAAPVAERYRALAIAPRFPRELYPHGSDYTFGVKRGDGGRLTLGSPGRWRDQRDYLYAEVEHLFEAVRHDLQGRQQGYYLFGHSAGAQFTHRLLTFMPNARVLGGVAANAGWYTLPLGDDARLHTAPYGLIGSPVDPADLTRLFEKPLVVLLGERDTATAQTDDLVRDTPEAEAQGSNRLERGRYYFQAAKARADALGAEFKWRIEIVPKAGHQAPRMIDSAGFLTFKPGEPPCVPTAAAASSGILFTEILADPPKGVAGDANGDGERDPVADEFVEIMNTGESPVCLAGWTLGDAEYPERHVFPLSRVLPPGATMVVFGGGVPTGPFNGAEVQWAESGLSLTNGGDVLTMRDGAGTVVSRFSWGDCARSPCADDHWPAGLDIRGSIVRKPDPDSGWMVHATVDGVRFSPGRHRERGSP